MVIKDIVELGGAGFLIPAVLIGVVAAGAKGLFGLFDRKSQTRKEFLELWDPSRAGDDVWLEVAVRHLFGEYLPARVIRQAMAQPQKTLALRDVCELWPLLQPDRLSGTMRWKHWRHATQRRRVVTLWLALAAYAGLFLLACLSAWVVTQLEPNTSTGWIFGIAALLAVLYAIECLGESDSLQTAVLAGDEWLALINSRDAPSAPRVTRERPPPVAAAEPASVEQ